MKKSAKRWLQTGYDRGYRDALLDIWIASRDDKSILAGTCLARVTEALYPETELAPCARARGRVNLRES